MPKALLLIQLYVLTVEVLTCSASLTPPQGKGILDALRERDTHVSTLGGRHTSSFLAEESR